VPMVFSDIELDVRVRTFTALRNRLRVAHVLGNVPLLPDDATIYDEFFAALWTKFPNCQGVHCRMVSPASFCWRHLSQSPSIRRKFFFYVAEPPCLHHSIRIPRTYDEYLSKFKSKHRSELRRQVKLLREHGNGALELQRIESREDVPGFLQAASQIVRASWQNAYGDDPIKENAFWLDEFTDLADRGLLRSYILRCGGRPCAFAFGYDFGGVHYADQTAYDSALRDLSPGTILQYLYMEDLIQNRPPRLLSFGFGHADYKQAFGNVQSEEATLLLVRNTFANRLRCTGHATYRYAVARLKQFARKLASVRARLRAGRR
jgi:hypothetical protein